MIRFFASHPVLSNSLFALLLLAGFITFQSMPVESFPDMEFGIVSIHVVWPGASPEDVERFITTKIEEEVAKVDDILSLKSFSLYGLCRIQIRFNEELGEEDYDRLYLQVQSEVKKVDDLPEDSLAPEIAMISTGRIRPILIIAVSGDISEESRFEIGKDLQEHLLDLPGMARISISGDRSREIQVRLNSRQAELHGFSASEVVRLIEQENKSFPGGIIQLENNNEILVQTASQIREIEQIENLIIRSDGKGNVVRLSDIADISWGYERWTEMNKSKGQKALFLRCEKEKSENTLKMIPQIKKAVEKFREKIPVDINFVYFRDSTIYINKVLRILESNLSLGLFFVLLVLWLWIGFSNAFLAIIGIPFSFLCALIFLSLSGTSVNEIVLVSFVLVSGMVVDDAIIIIENIYRHQQEGHSFVESACLGTEEVFWPVLAATATTIAAFLPMLIMSGMTGKVMSLVPKTVCFALFASLLEAFLIMPGHYIDFMKFSLYWQFFLPKKKKQPPKTNALVKKPRIWERTYLVTLQYFLRHRYWTLPLFFAIVITILATMLHHRSIPTILFPSEHHDFWINVETSGFTTIEETAQRIEQIEAVLKELPSNELWNYTIGIGNMMDENYEFYTGSHLAQFTVTLYPKREKSRSSDEVIIDLRQRLKKANLIGIAKIKVIRIPVGPQQGRPVAIRIRGKDFQVLQEISELVKKNLRDIPGVIQIDDDTQDGKPKFILDFREDQLKRFQLSRQEVTLTVTVALEGIEASKIHDVDRQYKIRVKYQDYDIRSPHDLENLKIKTPQGAYVHLKDIAYLKLYQGPAQLIHYDQKRSIFVTADLDTNINTSTAVNLELQKRMKPYQQKFSEYSWSGGGEYENTTKSFNSLKQASLIALALIYMILGTQFNSFWQPFLIMSIIPFALVGIAYGLWIFYLPFTMLTFISAVGLAGIVVNDSLVLIDFINRSAREKDVFSAVLDGTKKRLRPILLTTITTVLGLLPLALGLGGKSITWTPMATAFSWGLTFATLLTLFVIPAEYLILDDIISLGKRFNKNFSKKTTETESNG